jgi:hypothetical protein
VVHGEELEEVLELHAAVAYARARAERRVEGLGIAGVEQIDDCCARPPRAAAVACWAKGATAAGAVREDPLDEGPDGSLLDESLQPMTKAMARPAITTAPAHRMDGRLNIGVSSAAVSEQSTILTSVEMDRHDSRVSPWTGRRGRAANRRQRLRDSRMATRALAA